MDCCNREHPPSASNVKIVTAKNATFQEAYQFDTADVTSWDFTSKTFRMDIKGDYNDTVALISFTSGAGQIIVDDTTLRILHFNVSDTVLNAALVPGRYVYDLIMTDVNSVKTPLMYGEFIYTDGVTAP